MKRGVKQRDSLRSTFMGSQWEELEEEESLEGRREIHFP